MLRKQYFVQCQIIYQVQQQICCQRFDIEVDFKQRKKVKERTFIKN